MLESVFVFGCLYVWVCVCVRAFVCVHACVRACVRACVCVSGRVRVRSCVRACMSVGARNSMCIRLLELERVSDEFHLFDQLTCICAHVLVRVRAAHAWMRACVREYASECVQPSMICHLAVAAEKAVLAIGHERGAGVASWEQRAPRACSRDQGQC